MVLRGFSVAYGYLWYCVWVRMVCYFAWFMPLAFLLGWIWLVCGYYGWLAAEVGLPGSGLGFDG